MNTAMLLALSEEQAITGMQFFFVNNFLKGIKIDETEQRDIKGDAV